MIHKIKVQSVSKARKISPKKDADEMVAGVCYHYNYTLAQARLLPYKDVVLLMKIAKKEQAKLLYDMTQITAAPHTQKMKYVKTLTNHYKDIING